MAKVFSDRVFVAIDIGTTKICVLIAQAQGDDHIVVTGIGKSPSQGLKKGVVVNIGQTIYSIKQAIKEAEFMSGYTIKSAYIGISGAHISALSSQGAVPIKRGIVRQTDIDEALSAARAIPVPEGRQILHVIPRYFVIDNQERVNDPLSMHGVRLEVFAHVIIGSTVSIENLVTCCQQAGINVRDIILEPIASAYAVLSPDERELGAGLLDIGGGTADFAVYQHNAIRYTHIIPVAGNQFTRDIAIGLQTTLDFAQRLKHEYAAAHPSYTDHSLILDVSSLDTKSTQKISHKMLVDIVAARSHELLSILKDVIEKNNVRGCMPSGLIMTGGGALLLGINKLAQEILHMPIRTGFPHINHKELLSLKNPMYATAYGLLLNALDKNHVHNTEDIHSVRRVLNAMKSWVSDFF